MLQHHCTVVLSRATEHNVTASLHCGTEQSNRS